MFNLSNMFAPNPSEIESFNILVTTVNDQVYWDVDRFFKAYPRIGRKLLKAYKNDKLGIDLMLIQTSINLV